MKIDLRQRLFASSLTDGENSVTDADLEMINNLKTNGPLKPLGKDEIYVRRMIILGEEPTQKMSVHLQGVKGAKTYTVLSELAASLPGSPMLEGHRFDKAGWGRIFNAEVLEKAEGYTGAVLKISYYFLAADNGAQRAARIDGGIDAEGSISYKFKKAKCSICDSELMVGSFMGMSFERMKCNHKLGQTYDGVHCYWYPETPVAMEVSTVFRGAYGKTRSMLSVEQIPTTQAELQAAYADADADEIIGLALADAIIADAGKLEEGDGDGTGDGEGAGSDDGTGNGETGDQGASGNADSDPVTCAECGEKFEFAEEAEGKGMACPKCGVVVGKDGVKIVEPVGTRRKPIEKPATPPEEKVVGKYLVCTSKTCSYWQDNTDGVEVTDEVCPTCGEKLEVKDECKTIDEVEKPAAPAAEIPITEKNSFLVCKECGYSVESLTAAEFGICECHECGVELSESQVALTEKSVEEMKAESLKIKDMVGPVKPAKAGTVNNEFFEVEAFGKMEGQYYVEPKYDGVYMELLKSGNTVKLRTEHGADQSIKFPNIIAEAEKLTADNFVLIGEVVKYRGRQRGTHTDVTAYINSNGPYEDYHFRFKPFDIAFADGVDIRKEKLTVRRERLAAAVQPTAHIHPTKFNIVAGGAKLVRAIEAMSTREGAMIKDVNMTLTADGRSLIFKWKRHTELDVRVESLKEKVGGGYIYSCSVGSGEEKALIGDTYSTKIKAKTGDILQVTVDRVTFNAETNTYSWYAPKVLMLRDDKTEADPLSTVKKIADIKAPSTRAKNGIALSDVIALFEQAELGFDLFVCGGLVSKGSTEHDIDLLTLNELLPEEKSQVLDVLGEDYAPYADFIVNEAGPDSTHVKFAAKDSKKTPQAKYAKRFVLQRHSWGKAEHFDLRFGNPDGSKMWGFTCFKEPTKVSGGDKVRCEEKQYHDTAWMDFNGEIKPGNPGNPTKNMTALMEILDKGKYDFIKRKPKFLEVVLHGKDWSGRYVFRQIEVKSSVNSLAADDEAKTKGKIWVMWKPVDQTVGTVVNTVEHMIKDGVLFYWESNKVDEDSI